MRHMHTQTYYYKHTKCVQNGTVPCASTQGAFASNGVQGDWPTEEDPDGAPGIIMALGITPVQDGVLAAM